MRRRKLPIFSEHDTTELVRHYVGPHVWDSYYTFAVERHSFDKAVSRYHWHPGRGRPPIEEFFAKCPVFRFSEWPAYTYNDNGHRGPHRPLRTPPIGAR